MTIQSNSNSATTVATGIASSASNIGGVGMASKDSVSSYNGNNDASTHISREVDYGVQVAQKLNEFVSLIHSMSSEFEVVDQVISQSIQNLSLGDSGAPGSTSSLPYGGANRLLLD